MPEPGKIMSFANFHQHCMKCKKGKPCNKKHVYVMELKKYTKSQKFKDANPNYGRACHVYMLGKLRTIQDVDKVNTTTVKLGIGKERNGLVIVA